MKSNTFSMALCGKPGSISPTRIIVVSFCAVILTGTLLLMLPISTRDGSLSFVDAMFTATSATCVTGLVVFDTFTKFTPFGQAVVLLLIQIGGLGLVTLTAFFNVALHKRLGFKSMKLASESISLDEATGAKPLLYTVMRTSMGFELAGALLLMVVMVPKFGIAGIWISIFTAVSAFCNAGFDLFGRIAPYTSLTTFYSNGYVLAIVMLLIVCGGLGFIVWQELFMFRRRHKMSLHAKLAIAVTVTLIVVGALAIGLLEWDNPATMGKFSTGEKVLSSLFQSVTCRTAGFNTIDQAGMHTLSKLASVILMFIGACPGGTGGGIKGTTAIILFFTIISVIQGRGEAVIRGRRIDKKTVYRALTIVTLGFTVILFTTLVMIYDTPMVGGMVDGNFIDCLFEATSAFGTVGLSSGVTGQLTSLGKVVTALTMLIGRVGPIAMGMSLASRAGELARREILPEAKIVVG